MQLPEALSVLRNRNFRVYWLGQTVSLVGTWMQQMAQGWVVTRLTSQASALGILMVVGSLPIVLLGLKGGQFADRYNKRNILIVTQLGLMLLALALAALAFSGLLVLWHVFLLSALLGVVTAFDLPAAQAFAPDLVEPKLIGRAVAMMQAIFHGSRLIGPAIAGFLIERTGEGSAFLANGVSFLAVIGSLLAIPSGYRSTEKAARRDGSLLAGVRYVRSDAITRGLMLLMLWVLMLSFPFIIVLMVYYAKHVISVDARGMGAMMSGSGLGAVTGATVLVFASTTSWRARLWTGVAAIAGALIGLSMNHLLLPAIALTTVLSLGTSLCMGTINQAVQQRVPDELRGRVMALFAIAFTGVLPLSGLVLSLLADAVGLSLVMMACGPLFALLAAFVIARLPKTLELTTAEAR
jgi:MFS family permease